MARYRDTPASDARRRVHAGVALAVSLLLDVLACLLVLATDLLIYAEDGGTQYTGIAAAALWAGPLLTVIGGSWATVEAARASRDLHGLRRWARVFALASLPALVYLAWLFGAAE